MTPTLHVLHYIARECRQELHDEYRRAVQREELARSAADLALSLVSVYGPAHYSAIHARAERAERRATRLWEACGRPQQEA